MKICSRKINIILGIAYRINYDFIRQFRVLVLILHALDKSDVNNRSLAQFHIERCLNALELIAAPARFRCDTLPDLINTAFSN